MAREPKFTVAKVRRTDGLTVASHQRYVVKIDGEKIAEVKWSYRPKNAGGAAWQIQWKGEHGMTTSMYHRDRARLLQQFKESMLIKMKLRPMPNPFDYAR